jgi:hypothetical protein
MTAASLIAVVGRSSELPFTIPEFVVARPFLYHLTARSNVEHIARTRMLFSASNLMRQSGDMSFLRQKRRDSTAVKIGKTTISIRDQKPLHAGNIRFDAGWGFGDLVEALNALVFFWPGTNAGPISYGKRHFDRYASENPLILRFGANDLFSENKSATPRFCRFNSGSPRCSYGQGSPRGADTFVDCQHAEFSCCKAVEVTFPDAARLPSVVEVSECWAGPWRSL